MEKRFHIWKMLQVDLTLPKPIRAVDDTIVCLINGWPLLCEGKTHSECLAIGFELNDEWFVEE